MIQNYMKRIMELKEKINSHCMTYQFVDIEKEKTFRVYYPPGYQFDAVQASYADIGKIVALERILAAMERHWKESFPY